LKCLKCYKLIEVSKMLEIRKMLKMLEMLEMHKMLAVPQNDRDASHALFSWYPRVEETTST
jgi:hypothetical protein